MSHYDNPTQAALATTPEAQLWQRATQELDIFLTILNAQRREIAEAFGIIPERMELTVVCPTPKEDGQ